MIVFADLEWIEQNNVMHLTQLSALRVDKEWSELAAFDRVISIPASLYGNGTHMALGGLPAEAFAEGVSEQDCIKAFAQWLEPGDKVLVWAKENRSYLRQLWDTHTDASRPGIKCLAGPIRHGFRHIPAWRTPYDLLQKIGGTVGTAHRSSHDAEMLRQLLYRWETLSPEEKGQKAKVALREQNSSTIQRTEYNYIYLKHSKVFHTRTCRCCLAAKDPARIMGSVYYKTAANGRRPCRICDPKPLPTPKELRAAANREAARAAAQKAAALRLKKKEVIHVTLIDKTNTPIRRENIAGWCKYYLHPGPMTVSLLQDHDCLKKECPFLQKNGLSPYWEKLEQEKKQKEQKKRQKEQKKLEQAAQEADMNALTQKWQGYLTDLGEDMVIIKVDQPTPREYRIFYVSDNAFPDGNRYGDFIQILTHLHPGRRINLRHIKDINGRCMTTEQYQHRRRR